MDLREKAENLLLKNYASTGGKYIAPDAFHADQWLWDSCFHAIACAELGLNEFAKNEIEKLLKWQSEDGWIPHQIYKNGGRKWHDFERPLYKKEHGQFRSSITQPPLIAQAAEAVGDPEWIQKILPNLLKFYLYFCQKRDPDGDGLISICLPTETGRDTSPDLNFCRRFNPLWFIFSLCRLEWQYKKLDWDIEKIWQKNLFNVEDVMFNCIWIDGLRSLSRLISDYGPEGLSSGRMRLKELAEYIKKLADASEDAVFGLCWDENDKIFYNLNAQNEKIKCLTVSGLFPLILDRLPEKMGEGIVSHLTCEKEFWTPYPIPSTAKSDPAFDPDCGFYCNWRGPVWINMNWFIIRGLVKHGYRNIAKEIAEKTEAMIEREGFREFYNPLSGKGLREPTKGFGWSTLVVTFPNILK